MSCGGEVAKIWDDFKTFTKPKSQRHKISVWYEFVHNRFSAVDARESYGHSTLLNKNRLLYLGWEGTSK